MSVMKVENMVLGMVQTNCYLLSNRQTKECIIVDPADLPHRIESRISAEGYCPVAILLTHGHFDHIMAVNEIKKLYDIPIYAAAEEEELLKDASANLSEQFGGGYKVFADYTLKDGDCITLAGSHIKAILTPGHTRGSMCYYFEEDGFLISGDMLFFESVGRTDFPTGNSSDILKSLRERVLTLPEGTVVYPGHGESTDIAHEKAYNPYA